MLHDPDTSDHDWPADSGIQTEPVAALLDMVLASGATPDMQSFKTADQALASQEQERFYVSVDGSFDWKLPSQALRGDKDCTDTPPKMFALYIKRAAEKFCNQVAPPTEVQQ